MKRGGSGLAGIVQTSSWSANCTLFFSLVRALAAMSSEAWIHLW